MRLYAGALVLLLVLGVAQSCAPVPRPSVFRVSIPTLQAQPRQIPCEAQGKTQTCTVILTHDYEALVRELKTACLATGGTPDACQTKSVVVEGAPTKPAVKEPTP